MPDYSLGLSNLYGRLTGGSKSSKEPTRRSTGGGQSGTRAYSQRDPTPKPTGGPLTNLGKAAEGLTNRISTGLSKLYGGTKELSQDVQEISGKTQEAAGNFYGAIVDTPEKIVGGVTAPVGQLSKDVLPLAAIAAAVLLLR